MYGKIYRIEGDDITGETTRLLRGPLPTRRRAAASAAGGDQLAVAFAQRGGGDFFIRAADGGLGRGGPDSSTAAAPKADLDARGLVPKARTSCAMRGLLPSPLDRTRLVRSSCRRLSRVPRPRDGRTPSR
ncbi:hypothetical protein HPB52_006973 [Rhipicephalus sanguineus]|uniref:Uncharacterized protein n=1 Tax=Rhipicephalus sanguineus TaxID=34632 RepID=A0A9D4PQW9_RHISA|nr:hypothetical protein HPB52_006973 [Rhipicephalus sanguineus]